MNSVETGSDTEVGAVVHDPANIVYRRKAQVASVAENLPSFSLLIAILDQSRAARGELACEFEQIVLANEVGCVHDGIDTRQHGRSDPQGGPLGGVFMPAGEKTLHKLSVELPCLKFFVGDD